MYVFHAPLHLFVGLPLLDRYCGGHALGLPLAIGYAVAATVATFILAAISFHIYERRFLLLKDRLAPAGSGA
jgi:peptidoglycan/LPS O-acetylase OafA/YrhL